MATTKERFPHLSFNASPAARQPVSGAAGAWYRIIVVLAAVAALLALGLLKPATGPRPGVDGAGPSAPTAYDGRGKWGGAMPEWRSRSEILRDAGVTGQR